MSNCECKSRPVSYDISVNPLYKELLEGLQGSVSTDIYAQTECEDSHI